MNQTEALESVIRLELVRAGACTLDELNERLPFYLWTQVFSAVDRLTQKGIVTQYQDSTDHYVLSLTPLERERRDT